MAGEVLAGRDRPVLLHASDERRAQAGDLSGVLPEGAHVDDGVVGVVVDVQHRGEGHVDAHRPRLERRDAAHLVGEALLASGADRHERGEVGGPPEIDRARHVDGAPHAEAGAGLEVRTHEERDLGVALQVVQLRRDLGRGPDRHHEAPDPVLLDVFEDALVARRALRGVVAEHPGHDQLPHLLPQRHLLERALGPAPGVDGHGGIGLGDRARDRAVQGRFERR